jgi:hypothetical protein
MKRVDLPLPLFGFAVATRVVLGLGIGLLTAARLSKARRKKVGATLLTIGALTTIPIIAAVRAGKGPRRAEAA